jgi:hypothetical protein
MEIALVVLPLSSVLNAGFCEAQGAQEAWVNSSNKTKRVACANAVVPPSNKAKASVSFFMGCLVKKG